MAKVRVAIIGVGNCASSLVQGVQFYKKAKDDEFVPGLMHVNLGGYHIRVTRTRSAKIFQRRSSLIPTIPSSSVMYRKAA